MKRRFEILISLLVFAFVSCDDPEPQSTDTLSDVFVDTTLPDVAVSDRACGLLICSESEICCDYACVDPSASDTHCGACGVGCGPDETCQSGFCSCGGDICSQGESCCGAAGCVTRDLDPDHCGACGQACGDQERCLGGQCACINSQGGTELCASDVSCCPGLGCRAFEHDPTSCGGCGISCGPGELCVEGACQCGETLGSSGGTACLPGEACCGTPAECQPATAPECACGTSLCGSGQSCCEVAESVDACVSTWRDIEHCGGCGQACGAGETCVAGGCRCTPGRDDCNNDPTDGCEAPLATDLQNCGGCGQACAPGSVCNGLGVCSLRCQAGLTDCNGECVDLSWDREHCGACGNACEAGEVANGQGECALSCLVGLTDCGGECVDVQSNREHCSACGQACAPGFVCDGTGTCALSCQANRANCGGVCADLLNDRAHCGGCGVLCASGEVCNGAGACTATCRPGFTDCDGSCANLQNNRAHCGACGEACDAGEQCLKGRCQLVCEAGFEACAGLCVDLDTHPSHCGTCGARCPLGEVCVNGDCDTLCIEGFEDCGSGCVDVSSDAANCGGCGVACQPGELCTDGQCCVSELGCQGALDVGVGEEFACALMVDGRVLCWGDNNYGVLGDGIDAFPSNNNEDQAEDVRPPAQVTGLDGSVRATHLAVGPLQACVLLEDQQVLCWGRESRLSSGAFLSSSSTPSRMDVDTSVFPVVQLAVGGTPVVLGSGSVSSFVCALRADGRVFCRGFNEKGWLGVGDTQLRTFPTEVVGLNDAVAITAGARHACALRAAGEVICWGDNSRVQTGDLNAASSQTTPTPVLQIDGSPLSDVGPMVEIDAGTWSTCARSQAGDVYCWGDASYLDPGGFEAGVQALPILPGIGATDLANIEQLSVGREAMCVRSAEGAVGCYGKSPEGLLAADCDVRDPQCAERFSLENVMIPDGSGGHTPLSGTVRLDVGVRSACVIDDAGDVSCWGHNASGQAGARTVIGTADAALTSTATQIEASSESACAVTADGVACWGLVTGPDSPVAVPTPLASGVVDVAKRQHPFLGTEVCAIDNDGAVWCWGTSVCGGETLVPQKLPEIDGSSASAVDVTATSGVFCALLGPPATLRGVLCWGAGVVGELGTGTTGTNCTPGTVLGLSGGEVELASGANYVCARSSDGSVRCWGLFYGSSASPLTGIDGTNRSAVAIFGDSRNGCVKLDTDALWCFGENASGQLGTGTPGPWQSVPRQNTLVTGSDVVDYAAGDQHACVLLTDGSVQCWGQSLDLQVDGSSNAFAGTPRVAAGIDGVVDKATSIEGGFFHTCALLESGAVRCWGNNREAQLGDGSLMIRFPTLLSL